MRVTVIGGGPAGMMASACAASSGAEVTLFEKNEKLGKKLYITGKGRCNVTNVAEGDEFLANVATNPKFLYAAMSGFSSSDTIELIERAGVKLKTERGGRVFPFSDKASDITKALTDNMKRNGVKIMTESPVSGINIENGRVVSVESCGKTYQTDALIVATGGMSYPTTGSEGDGLVFAQNVGLCVVSPKPALCGLTTKKVLPLMGLTLKNVGITLFVGNKKRASEFGELLFTHTGISGPTVLSLSSKLNKYADGIPKIKKEESPIKEGNIAVRAAVREKKSFTVSDCYVSIDLKPALTAEALDKRILRDFESYKNKQLKNALIDLLPSSMIPVIIEYIEAEADCSVNSFTKEQRARLVSALKDLRLTVTGFEPLDNCIVTSGGVSVREIDASTMRCKRIPNLYFAGEVTDVDALTGGFNIQIALSTGRLAGLSAAQSEL